MGTRQAQVIAEHVEQGNVRVVRLDLPVPAVDPQRKLRHARPPWAGHAISDGASRGFFAETLPRAPDGRQADRPADSPRSRLAEKVPEGQADPLSLHSRLAG